jgi:3-hydroxyacyl-CoA dehydrogenase
MNLDELLTNVSVVGAAGKMGSGISALIVQQVALLKIKNPDKIYRVNLIDINEQAMDGLRTYIKSQLVKMAEKSIVNLRNLVEDREDLVENREVIDAFIDAGLEVIRFDTDLNLSRQAKMVFEVVIEKEDLKIKVLESLKKICGPETLFFTNTSSIPIGFLDKKVGLAGRIIGYHFYNPPIVQKLVEVISNEHTRKDLLEFAGELGARLRKKLVPSNDIAGFIGNGHFSRDGLYGLSEAQRLAEKYSLPGAIYIMNRISQDFLIRPMGIFQLIDYVGIDVFQSILRVIGKHQSEKGLKNDLIDQMMEKGVKGGQYSDGSQKNGFLRYEKNVPTGVYDLSTGQYTDIDMLREKLDAEIGDPPDGHYAWKKLVSNPDRNAKLAAYFLNLKKADQPGAELARNFIIQSKQIGRDLIEQGVAANEKDVNDTLMNGFYWLYGPLNDFI